MSTSGSFEAQQEVKEQEQTTTAIVKTDVVETTVTEQVQTVEENPTVETVVETKENETTIAAPEFYKSEEPVVETEQVEKQTTSWKDLIKSVDRKELLKEAGLDDFTIELNEHISKGGKAEDYLQAKAFNWDSVSDVDVIKNDYKKQFPNFSDEEIERLVNKKYGLTGDSDDDADALLLLKADAHIKREAQKVEQSKFKLPESKSNVEVQQTQLSEQELAQQRKLQVKQTIQQLKENDPSTKALMETKRVSVSLGDESYNFNVDPNFVMEAIVNPEVWNRVIATNPQEADVSKLQYDLPKLQKAIVMLTNPNYEKDIYNKGKSDGKRELIAEGQNAQKGVQQVSASNTDESLKTVWKSAKNSTIGNLQRN